MAARSSDGSDTDHLTAPEPGSCTMAINTKLVPLFTLLSGAKEEVIVTLGADGDTIVTEADALADRPPTLSVTSREKVEVVFAD